MPPSCRSQAVPGLTAHGSLEPVSARTTGRLDRAMADGGSLLRGDGGRLAWRRRAARASPRRDTAAHDRGRRVRRADPAALGRSRAGPQPFLVPDRFPVAPERAPIGVDTRPLQNPPDAATVADAFRPFDPAAGIINIDHLIFIVQENRSFDHYFGTFPGADGIPTDANGRPSVCVPDPEARGICHRPYHDTQPVRLRAARTARSASQIRSTAGKMDGFVRALAADRQRLRRSTRRRRRARRRRPGPAGHSPT